MTDTPGHLSCDVAIIGAGTAGLAAERAARKAGARTLLIDDGFKGTLCATTGCMPSKLLIAAARANADLAKARTMGIDVPTAQVNGQRVMARLQAERDHFVRATKASYGDLPRGTCIDARARFVAPDRLELSDGRQVSARSVIIATGSVPLIPEPYRGLGSHIVTNETLFDLDDLPESLAVLGAGPLGVELAQAMGRLGVRVTLFDKGKRLAKIRCDTVHASFEPIFAQDVTLRLGCEPQPSVQDDAVWLTWDGGRDRFDRVLVATGRIPALKELNLKAAGLRLDQNGVPEFDRQTMQCADSPIFLAGDADADAPVLHEASLDGLIAGTNAARFPAVQSHDRPPAFTITFTDPPIAAIGLPADECALNAHGDYSDQGRARVEVRAEGMLRLGADRNGRLVGADLGVPGGDHMAHLLTWAIMAEKTASDLLSMPFYHPTLEEGLKPALRSLCRQAGLEHSDSGNPAGA